MPVKNLILLHVRTQMGRQKYLSPTWAVPTQVNLFYVYKTRKNICHVFVCRNICSIIFSTLVSYYEMSSNDYTPNEKSFTDSQ